MRILPDQDDSTTYATMRDLKFDLVYSPGWDFAATWSRCQISIVAHDRIKRENT